MSEASSEANGHQMKPLTTLQDPLYKRIVERLETLTDHTLFERCVCGLLQKRYPTLVPVSGGNDAGEDGAIADGKAEAYPLVCTTSQDFVRNLRKSLDAQAKERFPRRKAVFVTSRRATPKKRRTLKEEARKRGFVLLQTVDQEGVAELLRHSSRWRKELGITGSASVLSVFPKSRRPSLSSTLVGREADLAWLRSTQGDRILSGQPGAGKTFLLRQLALEGTGLFLVQTDEDAIKDAILDLRLDESPEIAVLVDDAHGDPGVLDSLRNLREQMDGKFPIIASCWPGAQEKVAEALVVGSSKIHGLELMTRKEIARVYASAGVDLESLGAAFSTHPPEVLVKRLIDQAANKPGLAMTLASMVLKGEEADVFSGRSLLREVRAFEGLLGTDPLRTLAAFAAGGETGMPMEAVADFRGRCPSEIQEEVIGLATGGVLADRQDGNLAVEPLVLRSALLSEVFFRGKSTSLPIDPLLDRAPSRASAVAAAIWPKEAGAKLDEDWLESLVEKTDSRDVWALYASSGRERAERTARRYRHGLLEVGSELLQGAPEQAISWLIKAVVASGGTADATRRALEILARWVRTPDHDLTSGKKRRLLLRQIKPFLTAGVSLEVAFQALLLIFTADFGVTFGNPIMGDQLNWQISALSREDLEEVRSIWKSARDQLPEIQPKWAPHIAQALRPWLVPAHPCPGGRWTPEEEEFLQATGRVVLEDLAEKAVDSCALRSEFERQALKIGQPLGLHLDDEYEVLYPDPKGAVGDPEQWRSDHLEKVRTLARSWSSEAPQRVAARLASVESEAQAVGRRWQRMTPVLCTELAQRVQDSLEWLTAMDRAGVEDSLSRPFLHKAVEAKLEGWAEVMKRRLEDGTKALEALKIVLTLQEPDPSLLEAALSISPSHLEEIETLCLRGETPMRTLELLLEHPEWKVAASAAMGMWCAEAQGVVEDEIRPVWRQAVLRWRKSRFPTTEEYWLGEILGGDGELAAEWLRARARDGFLAKDGALNGVYSLATRALDREHRSELLTVLSESPRGLGVRRVVEELVADDLVLFCELLHIEELRGHHLRPLAGKPDEPWARKAQMAVDAGHAPNSVARQTIWGSGGLTIAGDGTSFWQSWLDAFTGFVTDDRPEVQEVAREGIRLIEKELEKAQAKKRERELVGYF